MDTPQHEKIVRHIILPDGTVEIVSESYYEQLDTEVVSHRKKLSTSNLTLARDVVSALSHIVQDKSPTLVLTIQTDKYGYPKEITKQWITKKEQHGRR